MNPNTFWVQGFSFLSFLPPLTPLNPSRKILWAGWKTFLAKTWMDALAGCSNNEKIQPYGMYLWWSWDVSRRKVGIRMLLGPQPDQPGWGRLATEKLLPWRQNRRGPPEVHGELRSSKALISESFCSANGHILLLLLCFPSLLAVSL